MSQPAATRQAVKLRALVATSLLVAILLVILPATTQSSAQDRGRPPAGPSPLEAEPWIRVRLAVLEPGQDIAVSGADARHAGPVRLANKGGALEAAGEPAPLPYNPKGAGEFAIGDRRYPGELFVVRETGSQRLLVVNRLGIETYLEGVVLSEMPPDSGDEALCAQAIASRSYAAWQFLTRRDKDFDVSDSQRSQVYKGSPARLALARKVVGATRGQVLVSGGQVLEAVFSSTCGGSTRSAKEAFGDESPSPLRGVSCGFCDGTAFSTWTAKVKRADAGRAIGLGGPVMDLAEAAFLPSGRLAHVDVRGEKTMKKLTGGQLRDLFGSQGRSTWFTKMEVAGDWVVVSGRGFGHGVGMCQVGAARLASAGRNARAILSHYYPGAEPGWLYPVHDH